MALFGVSTFLASKVFILNTTLLTASIISTPFQEYFVMEHDFYVGIGLAIVLTYLVKTQGPAFTAEYVNTTIFYG